MKQPGEHTAFQSIPNMGHHEHPLLYCAIDESGRGISYYYPLITLWNPTTGDTISQKYYLLNPRD
jgi:hypothetical protein